MLYRVEYGRKFQGPTDEKTGEVLHIHRVYPTPKWNDSFLQLTSNYIRLAVIRSPVERLISAYRNRVVHYGELSPEKSDIGRMEEIGIGPNPSLSEFIENFELYRSLKKSISYHTDPMVSFLGEDPSFYHVLVDIRQIDRALALVEAMSGSRPTVDKRQADGPVIAKSALSKGEIGKIREFYARDYEVFGEYLVDEN